MGGGRRGVVDKLIRAAVLAGALTCLLGCITSQATLINPARPAISAEQVQLYLRPPDSTYVEIANLYASSGGSLAISAASKMDKVVERLKVQAAKLGANGVLLHGIGDRAAGSIGAGISTEGNSPHASYGLGFGASAFFLRKSGEGIAIYVAPNP
jgi:hypothetical protein